MLPDFENIFTAIGFPSSEYPFIEALILALQPIWYAAIASVLISAFGTGVVLYAIFLAEQLQAKL